MDGKLEAILEHVRDTAAKLPQAQLERGVRNFLGRIYELGLELTRRPELRDSAEVKKLIADTIPVLVKENMALENYPFGLVRRFSSSWQGDEWEWLMDARSGLQFFLDLYAGTELDEYLRGIDTDHVDQFIRDREAEGDLPDERIPPVPLSHWWWWYPRAPGQKRAT